jgi:hypothetical protein
LWYILLRERNLLATQKEEARRMGVQNTQFQVNGTKVYHVRFSYPLSLASHRFSVPCHNFLGQEIHGTDQTNPQ